MIGRRRVWVLLPSTVIATILGFSAPAPGHGEEFAGDVGTQVELARSAPGQVLAVTANLKQWIQGRKEACPAKSPGDTGYQKYTACEGDERLVRFADRIEKLAAKPSRSSGDGMGGVAPDLVLLQEVDCSQSDAIASLLNERITIAGSSPDYRVAPCFRRKYDTDGTGADVIVNDTAIIYSALTMTNGSNVQVQTGYSKSQRNADCRGNDCKVRYKRHHLASFSETEAGGLTLGVASIHFVKKMLLTQDKTTMNDIYARWDARIADKLSLNYPVDEYDYHLVGGDTNVHRCAREGFPEPQECLERPWWVSLVDDYDYIDTIYASHGDPLRGGTDEALRRQWDDGDEHREARIDFVFSRQLGIEGPQQATPVGASHDLTCGLAFEDPGAEDCQRLDNPARYSDHRLVWSFVGAGNP